MEKDEADSEFCVNIELRQPIPIGYYAVCWWVKDAYVDFHQGQDVVPFPYSP